MLRQVEARNKLVDAQQPLTRERDLGVLAIGVFVVVTSSIVWLALKYTIGIRANEEDEDMGLDSAELGLEAYPEFGRGSQRA